MTSTGSSPMPVSTHSGMTGPTCCRCWPTAPEDLGFVLTSGPDDYVIVRYVGSEWVADTSPVDWKALKEEAFDEEGSDQ